MALSSPTLIVNGTAQADQFTLDSKTATKLLTGAGNDLVIVKKPTGTHIIDGGTGDDGVVVAGNLASWGIFYDTAGGLVLRDGTNLTLSLTLLNIERVRFSDGVRTAADLLALAAPLVAVPVLAVSVPVPVPVAVLGPLITPALPLAGNPAGVARTGATASVSLIGTGVAELMTGTTANNALRGGGGVDTLVGGAGDDSYYVGSAEKIIERTGGGIDTALYCETGTYVLPREVENVTILVGTNRLLSGQHIQKLGDAGGPSAIGNELANMMRGSAANNVLDGRGGNDVLFGGAGKDSFVFGKGYGQDTVLDFTPGVDKIRLISGFSDFTQLRAAMSDTASGVLLRLGTDSLLLSGKRVADLAARDFELPANMANYKLTFEDTFSNGLSRFNGHTGDDGGTWRTRMSMGEGTTISDNDGQWFVDTDYKGLGLNPFTVQSGTLSIDGIWRPDLAAQLGGRSFASGVISTEGTFAQQYGFFEARMKFSNAQGGSPAFWLLPVDHSWPPEIDIVEQLGIKPNEVFLMGNTQTLDTTQWNTYGIEWTADYIAWYLNGQISHVVYSHNQNKPMYVIINFAMGGSWAGPIAKPAQPGGTVDGIDIDYVRVYESTTSAAPQATVPEGAPHLTFSLGNVLISGRPLEADAWHYTADTSGILRLYPADLGFASKPGWFDVLLTNDRQVDSWRADVNNGWAGLNLQLTDSDGGRITVDDLALVEIYLGGTKNSQVLIDRSQFGLVETAAGNDTITITTAHKWILGRSSVFEVRSGAGNDTITGWTAGNTMAALLVEAGPGNDRVIGSVGADTIAGGAGNDVLTGGAGRDSFIFRKGEAGSDSITDFQVAFDVLKLVGYTRAQVSFHQEAAGTVIVAPDETILLQGLAPGVFNAQYLVIG